MRTHSLAKGCVTGDELIPVDHHLVTLKVVEDILRYHGVKEYL